MPHCHPRVREDPPSSIGSRIEQVINDDQGFVNFIIEKLKVEEKLLKIMTRFEPLTCESHIQVYALTKVTT